MVNSNHIPGMAISWIKQLLIFVIIVCNVHGFEHGAIFTSQSSDGRTFRERRSFATAKFGSLERGDRRCHDFCSMHPNLCRNGGTCVTNEATCNGECHCARGWSGKWCLELNVTREELPEIFGEAVRRSTENSSFGFDHEILKALAETKELAEALPITHKRSEDRFTQEGILSNLGNIIHAKPTTNDEKNPVPDLVSEPTDDIIRDACNVGCKGSVCKKVAGEYRCPNSGGSTASSALRECGPGFPCDNGVCDVDELRNSYKCVCDRGYVGQFCESQCPLDCGRHGTCDLVDGDIKCICFWNYTGLRCTELIVEEPGECQPRARLLEVQGW